MLLSHVLKTSYNTLKVIDIQCRYRAESPQRVGMRYTYYYYCCINASIIAIIDTSVSLTILSLIKLLYHKNIILKVYS
jgi:hypothetical protein